MMRSLQKVLMIAQIEARSARTYMANILGQQIGILLRIWIISQLYAASLPGAAAQADVALIVWTVALTQALGIFTHYEVDRRIESEVQSGQIAYRLLQPIAYPLSHLGLALGYARTYLPVTLCSASFVTWLLVGGIAVKPGALLGGSILLAGGMALHFLIALAIGLLSLRVEDISGFRWVYQKCWIAFGGMIIPVQQFPDWLRGIAEALPFTHLFSSAAAAIVNANSVNILAALAVQWSWIVVLLAITTLLYRSGIRHLSVQGG